MLAERRRNAPLPGALDAHEKEEMRKRMMESQQPKEKGKWKWVLNAAVIILVLYLLKGRSSAPVRPGYPGYN